MFMWYYNRVLFHKPILFQESQTKTILVTQIMVASDKIDNKNISTTLTKKRSLNTMQRELK